MNDSLSQKEIDWLIEGRGPEDAAAAQQEAVPYSFRRPPRIRSDRQSMLESIHSKFTQSLQALLTDRLRERVEISIASVEQVNYSELLLSLTHPSALFVLRLRSGGQEHGILDLGNGFAFHAIDRMLGGPGAPAGHDRRLTHLEEDIAARVAGWILDPLREAWGVADLDLAVQRFESDPELLQIMQVEDPIAVLLLDFGSEQFSGQIMIGFPAMALDALCESYILRFADLPDRAELRSRGPMEPGMRQVKMAVTACLPLVSLPAGSILALKEGDLIDTGHPLDTPLEIHLNGRQTYAGSVGQIHRRLALKITSVAKRAASGRWEQGKEGKVQ